jgi:hypothetical protein
VLKLYINIMRHAQRNEDILGEFRYSYMHSELLHYTEVTDRLHAPPAFLQVERRRYPLDRGLGGSLAGLDAVTKKKPLPAPTRNRTLVVQPVALSLCCVTPAVTILRYLSKLQSTLLCSILNYCYFIHLGTNIFLILFQKLAIYVLLSK